MSTLAGTPSRFTRTFAAFQVRNFRLYAFGQFCSLSGNNAEAVALGWLVLQLTGSGTALGLVTASKFVPMLVLAPLTGPIVDRVDKRKLLLVTQLAAATVSTLVGVLALVGVARVWNLVVAALVLGTINALDTPGRLTLIREMVPKIQVHNVLALNNSIVSIARIAGPAAAGIVITVLSIPLCFFLNTGTYLALFIAVASMKGAATQGTTNKAKNSFVSGLRYVRETPRVFTGLVVMAFVGTFTYEFWITLPILIRNELHRSAATYALCMSVMSLGSLASGLAVAGKHEVTQRSTMVGVLGFGAATAMVGLAPTLPLVLIAVIAMGLTYAACSAMCAAFIQANTDAAFQGRVTALWTAAFVGSTAVGGPIVGWIAQHYGVRLALMLGGAVAIAAALWGSRQPEGATPHS